MWASSLEKFRKQKFETDVLINYAEDNRYGMTLLARPSVAVKERIEHFLNKVRKYEPNQYFYPQSDIHLTILSIISCSSGFSLGQIKKGSYIEIIGEVLESMKPFGVYFKGITASPSCIMIQGFPENNELEKLRNKLRHVFKNSVLQHSVDKRYNLKTAHLTVIRFSKPLQQPEPFISALNRYRDYEFGHCLINELELVGNNWYQQKEKVQLIERFKIS